MQDGAKLGGEFTFFGEQLSRSDRQRPFVESIRKFLPDVVGDEAIMVRVPAIKPPSART